MHKPITSKSYYSLSQKDIEPELEGSIHTLVSDRSPNAPQKTPFPWRMLLTLVIGLPAAAIGLVLGGLSVLYLVFGDMACGGGPVPNSEKAPTATPATKSAKPVSPRS